MTAVSSSAALFFLVPRHPMPAPALQQPPPTEKGPADYIYYKRRPDGLTSGPRARDSPAKVKPQSHCRLALETVIDLNLRCVGQCSTSLRITDAWDRSRGAELERSLADVQEPDVRD